MKKIKLLFVYSAVISTVMLFSKCTFSEDINELKESLNEFTVYLTTPSLNTGVHFEFVDARTNEILEESDVSVTVTGKDAALVYNNIGSKEEFYTSNWGTLDLVIDPHKADSASLLANPIQFEVTTSLAGYVSETQSVSIYETKMQTVRIPLTSINNPPEGVTFTETVVAINTTEDGSISEDLVVELSGSGQGVAQRMKGQTTPPNIILNLIIPKGIKFTYGNQPYKSLSVTAQIANFPENGIITFPDQRLARFDSQGHFYRFGSIKLNIKVIQMNGQQIDVNQTYNGFLTLQLVLPNNYIDPIAMQPIKENDIIERFNFDGFKLTKDLVKKVNGRFVVESLLSRFPTSTQQYGKMLPPCSNGIKSIVFDFDDNSIRQLKEDYFQYRMITTKEKKIIYGESMGYGRWKYTISESKINYPLTEGSAKVVFYHRGDLKFTPDTLLINSMCEDKKYFVAVESAKSNSGINLINLNLDMSIMSETNSNYVIKPSIVLYYGQYPDFLPINLKNGKASLTVLEGAQYLIRAALGKSKAEGSFKIENDSPTTYKISFTQQLSRRMSDPVTIIVPKTESNEVTLKYDIPVSDNLLGSFN